jgi:hypothetical protein
VGRENILEAFAGVDVDSESLTAATRFRLGVEKLCGGHYVCRKVMEMGVLVTLKFPRGALEVFASRVQKSCLHKTATI